MIVVIVFFFVFLASNSASAGALGPRTSNDFEHGRFLYVTALDGQKHLIDRMAEPLAYEVFPADITFHLFTRQGDDGTAFNMEGFTGDLGSSGFDPTLPTYIFHHGWGVDYTFTKDFPVFLLDADNGIAANVFLVDYRRIAKFFYTYAVGSLPEVGQIIAEGIKKTMQHYGMGYGQINILGHSLGGQLCAFVGSSLDGQANQIISLDPAGPIFQNSGPSFRLDPTDAKYVQVIHTNGGLIAYRGSCGDSDYFPNSGMMNQPNCGSDLIGLCAHERAVLYYFESLHSDQFVATKCDSWEEYLEGSCAGNEKSSMGMIVPDKGAMGNYYLETAGESPFALG